MTADLDHVRTNSKPELTKGQRLCKALPSCEGHLQNGLMLFVAERGVLGHVDRDFSHSDESLFIMTMLGCSLDLENVFLQVTDMGVLFTLGRLVKLDLCWTVTAAGSTWCTFSSTSAACLASV